MQSPSATRLDPALRFYIHRKHSNAIVPLIPADQLPFALRDFPKHLSHRELSEGGWRFLAETEGVAFPLPLGMGGSVEKMVGMSVDETPAAGAALKTCPTIEACEKEGTSTTRAPEAILKAAQHKATPTTKIPSLTDSLAAIYITDARRVGYTKPSAHPKRTVAAVKHQEHCRHWVKTGVCKWTATREGCRYKHEMPGVEKRGEGKGEDVCGVYTTDTTGELMLMDVDVDVDVGRSSCTTPPRCDTSHPPTTTPAATPSSPDVSSPQAPTTPLPNNATAHTPPTQPAAAPRSTHPSAPTTPPPPKARLTPTTIPDTTTILPLDISTSSAKPSPIPTPVPPTKPASPSPTTPKPKHPRKASPSAQVGKTRPTGAPTSTPLVKKPAERRAGDGEERLERIFARRKVGSRYGCTARVKMGGKGRVGVKGVGVRASA